MNKEGDCMVRTRGEGRGGKEGQRKGKKRRRKANVYDAYVDTTTSARSYSPQTSVHHA